MVRISSTFCALASFIAYSIVSAETVYTGDIISGHKVVTRLDIDDIPENSLTKLWLRTTHTNVGQRLHVPLLIAKGCSNVNGMYNNRREYVNRYEGDILTDMNREFPGKITNRLASQKFVSMIWDGVFSNNSFTAAVDMHTDTSDNELPNFVFADLTIPYVYRMTELTGADVIKIDLGSGTLGAIENILDYDGVPSITLELGKSKSWQKDQIQRGYDYVFRQMADLKMYPPTEDPFVIKAYEEYKAKSYYGNEYDSTGSTNGGFVELHVKNLDIVTTKTKAATVYNVFGDVMEIIYPKFDGVITSFNHYPLNEPGVDIILTIHNSTDPACVNGC
ncbi:hypothetical protein AYI69_g9194 [Smittium culicis]|uniref:Succinylglutamate desuccinylase/Aspartoacylase catalytic domain-containing protein n=1 Tax=Smittium culicis TaxID=133412 RepID=A0A1R1XE99_9FUNG|nr:hypothetical protein AYI69_g9194 [Smittium culicis]